MNKIKLSLTQLAFQKFGIPDIKLDAIFKFCLSQGADLVELYFEKLEPTRIFFEGGRLDRLSSGLDGGLGLRLFFKNRTLYAYTTRCDEHSIMEIAQQLISSGEALPSQTLNNTIKPQEQPEWFLSQQKHEQIAHFEVKKPANKCPLDEKIELCARIERAARTELAEARQVSAALLESCREILIINSQGRIATDRKYYLQCYAQVVAEKAGRVESAYESDGGFIGLEFFERRSPEEIGRSAAKKVRRLLEAEPAPAGQMTVVLSSEAGGTMIHEAVGHGLEADLACNGLSVYQNQLGQLVASPLITVIDDGTMPEKRGSYCFDDEGTPSQKTVLIEKGILKSYLVDQLSAKKFGLVPTGNGRRESFRHQPIVRMTNTYVQSGDDDPKAILADTARGIFVKAMGGGQVNTVTGDFVFAVTEGYIISHGKIAQAIRGATLVGNGPQVIRAVDRVGSDLGFATGTCGKDGQAAPVTDAQPTMRIPSLTVGGEVPQSDYWPEGF